MVIYEQSNKKNISLPVVKKYFVKMQTQSDCIYTFSLFSKHSYVCNNNLGKKTPKNVFFLNPVCTTCPVCTGTFDKGAAFKKLPPFPQIFCVMVKSVKRLTNQVIFIQTAYTLFMVSFHKLYLRIKTQILNNPIT